MGFKTTNRGVWTFDETLEDASLSNDFVSSSGSPLYASFSSFNLFENHLQNRSGLSLENNKTFESELSLGFDSGSYCFNIMFWWYSPRYLGKIKHVTSGLSTPVIAPIVAKANTAISDGIEASVAGESEFIISEIGHSDNLNAIRISLFGDNSNVTHEFESEPYDIGLRHINVQYSSIGSKYEVRIDIDGKRGKSYVGPSMSSSPVAKLRINDVISGYSAHKVHQYNGIIGDLVLSKQDGISPVSMIIFGWEYIAKDEEEDDFSFLGFSYTKPSTISTNYISASGGDILIARSNGDIRRGSKSIWDNEFNFINLDSIKFLNISKLNEDSSITLIDSGLEIKGSTIKI